MMVAKNLSVNDFYHTYLEPEDAFEWIILLSMVGAFIGGIIVLVYTFSL